MLNKFRYIKILITFLITAIFTLSNLSGLYAYSQMPEFLCEMGIRFYQQGKYEMALEEFKKALLISPNYEPALKYLQMIEQESAPQEEEAVVPPLFRPSATTRSGAIKEFLDLIELQQKEIKAKKQLVQPQATAPLKEISALYEVARPGEVKQIATLTLDESLSRILQPIEIEQGNSVIVIGNNIKRFLVTQPNIVSLERNSADELSLTGKDIGYTYVHFWDDNGRWTAEFLGVPPKPEGPTVDELARLEEEKAGTFKFRHSLDWRSFEQGRRINALNREYFSWYHNLSLTGATPYGNLDSGAIIRTLRETTDLTYFTVGLTEGRWGPFKGFTLRAMDLDPGFGNLVFGASASSVRGAMVKSPAFNKKLDYTVFWGREGGGRYGNLSPGLKKIQDSFLNGLDLNYNPIKSLNFGFSTIHGYGRDRPLDLNNYVYDADVNWYIDKWKYRYEIGFNNERFAHIFNSSFIKPKLNFAYELRNIDKSFTGITGQAWRKGELGGLFILGYAPHPDWYLTQRLDVFQDRLFPSPENENRWNQDYDVNARYNMDPSASLRLSYAIQNYLGRVSQSRNHSPGFGLSKSFHFIRNISLYFDYLHQDSKNYTAHSADYMSENIFTGLRFNLTSQLYYYLNTQWSWIDERFTGRKFSPYALETGLDLTGQIANSAFYKNIRFVYRDEQNAGSNLSFLSGEDYIEGYAELSFRPSPDKEAYCSARVRNVWAESPTATKRVEADFHAGMRYLWDTGVRWESVGNIEGYVFKDLNSDGLRQRDEAPVEGIKVWLGKNKSATSDVFGYYKFTNIKGKKAFMTIDTQTVPAGFVITVPQTQEAVIMQGQAARVDFGIVSRSEISGIVFYDSDGDGEYNKGDTGIKDAVLILENGAKTNTDNNGVYYFRNVPVGEHAITLNLKSISLDYLPQVPLTKKISLFEGVTYSYNIPLKKIKK